MKHVISGVNMENVTIQQSVTICMARFLKIFVAACQYKYILICGIKGYGKVNGNSSDSLISGSGIPLTYDSTIDSLNSLGISLNAIYTWLKLVEYNYAWH